MINIKPLNFARHQVGLLSDRTVSSKTMASQNSNPADSPPCRRPTRARRAPTRQTRRTSVAPVVIKGFVRPKGKKHVASVDFECEAHANVIPSFQPRFLPHAAGLSRTGATNLTHFFTTMTTTSPHEEERAWEILDFNRLKNEVLEAKNKANTLVNTEPLMHNFCAAVRLKKWADSVFLRARQELEGKLYSAKGKEKGQDCSGGGELVSGYRASRACSAFGMMEDAGRARATSIIYNE